MKHYEHVIAICGACLGVLLSPADASTASLSPPVSAPIPPTASTAITSTTTGATTTTSSDYSQHLAAIRTDLQNSNVHIPDLPINALDFDPDASSTRATIAHTFLTSLARSPTFRSHYWHRHPLLLKYKHQSTSTSTSQSWVPNAFTVQTHLRQIHNSFISGHKTAEILRNGTDTSTWAFVPLKSNPARATTWTDVTTALTDGTIYFNSAGALWKELGALCRITQRAFGVPANVNVYVTPYGCPVSVPPHTDRQDVVVFQTEGRKRWRVFYPPPRSKETGDPLNRGKNGNVLGLEEMSDPILDIVMEAGDVLYVPTGFPHTTDTVEGTIGDDEVDQKTTSVHLTMGLDTHVFGLTYAHLRWAILQQMKKVHAIAIRTDEVYWQTLETLPLGFLAPEGEWERFHEMGGVMSDEYVDAVATEMRRLLIALEPQRWDVPPKEIEEVLSHLTKTDHKTTITSTPPINVTREPIPTRDEMTPIIRYFFETHAVNLFAIQNHMFTNVNPHSDDTIMKAYHSAQDQNKIMGDLGAFAGNADMKERYEIMEQKRKEWARDALAANQK